MEPSVRPREAKQRDAYDQCQGVQNRHHHKATEGAYPGASQPFRQGSHYIYEICLAMSEMSTSTTTSFSMGTQMLST